MLHLHRILNGIWMIDSDYAANYLPLISAYIKGETPNFNRSETPNEELSLAVLNNNKFYISEYGRESSPEDAPDNSIAIITSTGVITKHDQGCGPSGMVTKANLMNRCFASDKIKGILFKTDSGGGESGAMRLMNETIAKRNKPVIGFVDDFACSAAYGNISACDMIIANNEMARIGSIGTYLTVADLSERYKQMGVNLIEIYATASVDKNKDYYEALKGNTEPLKKMVDVVNESFLSQIEKDREGKLTADRKVWGTGKVYFANEALELGLIDAIDSFENVLNYF